MKKRIVALILTVVLSLLALTSCGGFDFAEENLDAYGSFKYDEFMAALDKIEIKDGAFTANADKREQYIKDQIYNAVADAIVTKKTAEEDKRTEGTVEGGDVFYFVYYAVDAKGNLFFVSSDMQTSSLSGTNKSNHIIKLGDVDEDNKFINLVNEKIAGVDIKDYIYSPTYASDLRAKAEAAFDKEAYKAENPDATEEQIKAAVTAAGDAALKVAAGDKVVLSYTKTYKKTVEGKEVDVTESATYDIVVLNSENALYNAILNAKIANVGDVVKVVDPEDATKTVEKFTVTEDGVECTYSSVKILYNLNGVNPITSFTYTPYEVAEDSTVKNEYTPNSSYESGKKANLNNVELTYYVYPVYVIDAPSYDEIKADFTYVLDYVIGKNLTATYFKAFEDEEYKNGDKKLADLIADIATLYNTSAKDNKFYKDGSDLKKALDEYNKVNGDTKSTTAQKNAAKAALEKLQFAELQKITAEIVKFAKGETKLADTIFGEYYDMQFRAAEKSYNSAIITAVQTEVWALIQSHVTLTGKYPEELVEQFSNDILEGHEYTYYTGSTDSVANKLTYKTFEDYLMKSVYKVSSMDEVNKKVKAEAEGYIKPLLQIYIAAKALEKDAVAALSGDNGYIALDIAAGKYVTGKDTTNETFLEMAKANAGRFIVNDEYMKAFKNAIGKATYDAYVEENGEINVRASEQFNKLFEYLTSYEFKQNTDDYALDPVYDGEFIKFRELKYSFKADK